MLEVVMLEFVFVFCFESFEVFLFVCGELECGFVELELVVVLWCFDWL